MKNCVILRIFEFVKFPLLFLMIMGYHSICTRCCAKLVGWEQYLVV